MHPKLHSVDRILARLAAGAHGVVTRDELIAAGVTDEQLKTRLRRGSLIRIHRGVYRVGHAAPTTEAAYTAAVKACGEAAAISGRAAAQLHGLLRASPPPPPEVTTPTSHRPPGVVVHRAGTRPETVRINRIPTTNVPRTLIDLAAHLDEAALGKAVHEAMVRHGTRPHHVETALARTPRAKGSRTLRRILRGDTNITLSDLERAFLRLLRRHRLPLPETNKKADGHYVDCRWPDSKLTVELDGYRYHASRHAWEQDRRRERAARARGDEFRHYSWGEITGEAGAVAAEIRSLLNQLAHRINTPETRFSMTNSLPPGDV